MSVRHSDAASGCRTRVVRYPDGVTSFRCVSGRHGGCSCRTHVRTEISNDVDWREAPARRAGGSADLLAGDGPAGGGADERDDAAAERDDGGAEDLLGLGRADGEHLKEVEVAEDAGETAEE